MTDPSVDLKAFKAATKAADRAVDDFTKRAAGYGLADDARAELAELVGGVRDEMHGALYQAMSEGKPIGEPDPETGETMASRGLDMVLRQIANADARFSSGGQDETLPELTPEELRIARAARLSAADYARQKSRAEELREHPWWRAREAD